MADGRRRKHCLAGGFASEWGACAVQSSKQYTYLYGASRLL